MKNVSGRLLNIFSAENINWELGWKREEYGNL